MKPLIDRFPNLQEIIAKGIYEDGAFCGVCEYEGWGTCEDCMKVCRKYALTAMNYVEQAVQTESMFDEGSHCKTRRGWTTHAEDCEDYIPSTGELFR